MEINGLQIASVVFSLSMIFFTYYCFRKKYFGAISLIIWGLVFFGIIITSIFPSIFKEFLPILKVARLFDLFIVVGIFFLIVLTFINFIHLQKLRKKLGHYVQKDALDSEETQYETSDGETS